MKPLSLSTKRITLRRALESDAEILFENYFSTSVCSTFLTRQSHVLVSQTRSFLNNWCNNAWDNEVDNFGWVIALSHSNEAIGVFLVMLDGHKAQIHFGISHNFWRQGLITESGYAVIYWLLGQAKIQRIWAVCDLLNIGSAGVLEKLNFYREGILKKWLILPSFGNEARDCYIYGRTF